MGRELRSPCFGNYAAVAKWCGVSGLAESEVTRGKSESVTSVHWSCGCNRRPRLFIHHLQADL